MRTVAHIVTAKKIQIAASRIRADIFRGGNIYGRSFHKSDVASCHFLTRVKVLTAGGFSWLPPLTPSSL